MASAVTDTEQINIHLIQKQDNRHRLHTANSSVPDSPLCCFNSEAAGTAHWNFTQQTLKSKWDNHKLPLCAFLYMHTNLYSRNQAWDRPNDFTPMNVSRYQGKSG